jgi:hypothetical protein
VVSGALAISIVPLFTAAFSSASAASGAGGAPQAPVTLTVGGTGDSGSGSAPTSCELGNGVKHVIEITFDNVHFFRDNPNVPSDLEMMPHLLNFIEQNGT